MELELSKHVQEMAKRIKCPVCLESFEKPMMLTSCSHIFCKKCLDIALTAKLRCPVCNVETRKRQVMDAPKDIEQIIELFRNLLDKLDPTWDKSVDASDLIAASEAHLEMVDKLRESSHARYGCSEEAVGVMAEASVTKDIIELRQEEQDEEEEVMEEEASKGVMPEQRPRKMFAVGSTVHVIDRCWIGINKPGGQAFVTHVHNDTNGDGDGGARGVVYDLKFVLDGRVEACVPAVFVEEPVQLERRSRHRSSQPIQSAHLGSLRESPSPGKNPSTHQVTVATASTTNATKTTAAVSRTVISTESRSRKRGSISSSHSRSRSFSRGSSSNVSSDKEDMCNASSASGELTSVNSTSQAMAKSRVTTRKVRAPALMSSEKKRARRTTPLRTPLPPVAIVTTSADDALLKRVQTFVQAFGTQDGAESWLAEKARGGQEEGACSRQARTVSVESSFGSHVTHLVGTEKTRGVLKQRTMKFMQAVAHGLWIVSGSWLSESAKRGWILPEYSFEITGTLKSSQDMAPLRARLDVASHDGRGTLFSEYQVYFHGDFPSPGPQKSALQELVSQAGGAVMRSLEELQHAPGGEVRVLVVSASEDLANTDSLGAIEGGEVQCVDSYWVMNSITDYCVEDLHKSKARAASAKC